MIYPEDGREDIMSKKHNLLSKSYRLLEIALLTALIFSCVTPVPVPEEEPPAAPKEQQPVPSSGTEEGIKPEPEAFTPLEEETWGLGQPSSVIDAPGIKSPYQLYQFFMANRPDADGLKVARLASYYVEEGLAEGINSDVAFVQMCLETGWLSFGNLVTEDMNNFCGLGAIDEENRGNVFESERMGVRAHIQHLHAYGTTRELNRTCIDVRYKWVNPRGKAPTVDGLSGTWAADRTYGSKLQNLLDRLAEF